MVTPLNKTLLGRIEQLREQPAELEPMDDPRAEARRSRLYAIPMKDELRDALERRAILETESVKRARAWFAARDKPWLALSAGTGCGKTAAAIELVVEHGGYIVSSDEIVSTFSSMFGEQYENQQRYCNAALLVIDELGAELDHTRMLPALTRLLNARQSAKRTPTVVTTNLSARELREMYNNERLLSRMADQMRWEQFIAPDMRRSRAAAS